LVISADWQMGPFTSRQDRIAAIALISCAVVFLYFNTLVKLVSDWWTDENYSHGLLVPFVIGLIVYREWGRLESSRLRSRTGWGMATVAAAATVLTAGTLAAELFTQRVSLVIMLAGLILYFFGFSVVRVLSVPFALLILAVPIPQIVFNRFAFPLQLWASQMAVWGIRLFEVPTVRNGNVIDILPKGSTQPISLEVVEACSGIRSLMTLATLALVLGYFTRRNEQGSIDNFSPRDLVCTLILITAAIPIAVLTNAARVTATAMMTYWVGKQATGSTIHDVSGLLVFVAALGMLLGLNWLTRNALNPSGPVLN
jgi:exosortase